MNETSVHVVITDVRRSDPTCASSVVKVPSGVGRARFRAAAFKRTLQLRKQATRRTVCGRNGCRTPTGWVKAKSVAQTRCPAIWSRRSRGGGTESSSEEVNWGPSESRRAAEIRHKAAVALRSSDVAIVSEEAGGQNNHWRSQGPLGGCVESETLSAARRKSHYGIQREGRRFHSGRVKVAKMAAKGTVESPFEAVLGKTRRTEF